MKPAAYYHIGILVRDLDQAISRFSEVLGVKFTERTDSATFIEDPKTGKTTEQKVVAVYAMTSPSYLELIQAGGDGVLSMDNADRILYFGVWEPDMEGRMKTLQQQGIGIDALLRPERDKPPIAFFTGPDLMGVRIEYVDAALRGATEAWVRTGKLPGGVTRSTILTVIFSIRDWIKGLFAKS